MSNMLMLDMNQPVRMLILSAPRAMVEASFPPASPEA